LDGPQGRTGPAWKISPPPGFDPWIGQPVAIHYTDFAIPAHIIIIIIIVCGTLFLPRREIFFEIF
jgi:hypothetical protein